jgi:uncharacterized protein YgiM (DUF1202 family)
MTQQFEVRAIKDYEAQYLDPIQAKAGDEVSVDPSKETDILGWVWCTNRAGKSGWIPTAYVEIDGDRSRLLYDYNAIELTIHAGEALTVHKTESGFHWATNENGQQGWIPITHVEPIGE